ncbi:MAG: HAMP domain-containing methyl-accepting chemotaxis protein [Desulfobacteraceae bacterium]
MNIKEFISNLKVRHKLQVSGILYIILITIVAYFFASSNNLIKQASGEQRELNNLSSNLQHVEMAVKDYVFQKIPITQLQKKINDLIAGLKNDDFTSDLKKIGTQTNEYEKLRIRNVDIENRIDKLTDGSINASNNTIGILSKRLVGKDTRAGVSNMERAVIAGANTNTTANFRIKLLFQKLKQDIGFKNELQLFLNKLIENVTRDAEALKGTEFEEGVIAAKKDNLLTKELVQEFIDNTDILKTIEMNILKDFDIMAENIETLVVKSSDELFSTIKGYFTQMIVVILVISIIGILVNFILGKAVSGSLDQLNLLVKDLAEGEGDLTKRIAVKSKDETGELAGWINLFVEKLQTIIKDVSTNADSLNSSSTELMEISQQMSQGAGQSSEKSNTVAAAAEEMSANMNSVATASEEASTNVSMVASATEEMAVTVKEIAKNSEKARGITNDAVEKATGTTVNINKLGEAADQISKVTEVITEISEQTNLLALNATIEAARAGEAGKGFAVVANEIKELARQTATATQEIKSKIEAIQSSSNQTVDEIKIISEVIKEVDNIVSSIAAAVEEQSVSTQEIAGNVAQASQGIREVNENVNQSSAVSGQIAQDIADVNQTAAMLTNSSSQVNISAEALSELSGKLHQMVSRFKL